MKALLKNLAIALALISGTYAAGVTGLCLAASNTNCDRATASTQIVESLCRQDLLNALTVMLPYIGYPRSLNALAAINSVSPAK